jgi:hypothetical protein
MNLLGGFLPEMIENMKDHKDGEGEEAGPVTEEDISHLMEMLKEHLEKEEDFAAV